MIYLLDTNVISDLSRNVPIVVANRNQNYGKVIHLFYVHLFTTKVCVDS